MCALPSHTFPGSTLYSTARFAPPDDLRLERLGRPVTSFGPRSFRPTRAETIAQVSADTLRPQTSRVETFSGRADRRSYIVTPNTFDVRFGRSVRN